MYHSTIKKKKQRSIFWACCSKLEEYNHIYNTGEGEKKKTTRKKKKGRYVENGD